MNEIKPRKPVYFVEADASVLEKIKQYFDEYDGVWQMKFFSSSKSVIDTITPNGAVVVADWEVTDMGGLELATKIRQFESENNCPGCHRILLTGLEDLDQLEEALASAADEYITKPYDLRELVARVKSAVRSLTTIQNLRQSNQRHESLATADPLTELHNRRHGSHVLKYELSRAARGLQDLSLIMLDVDHLSAINDEHGRDVGDIVLKRLSALIRRSCRDYDRVIRWSDDKILVVCPHTSQANVSIIANRLLMKIGATPIDFKEKQTLKITSSVGTTTIPENKQVKPEEIVRQVYAALKEAKQKGPGQLVHT